jgi:hypothetical protein
MPGKLYKNDVRLSKAFAEGSMGVPAANPHPAGSPAAAAYDAGAAQTLAGNCQTYAGVAECSGSAEPVVRVTMPDDTWLKADIQAWLTDAGIEYPSDATKAELLALAGAA